MFAFGIFKVIYSPLKAFREIIQNPKYLGPILVMILLVIAYTGSAYVVLSKTYNEQILPVPDSKHDEWTENSTLWTSNVNVSESTDALSGGYYGNKSIQFAAANDSEIWGKLDPVGPVNCSGLEGYKNMSFRVKLLYPSATVLNNASLYLFSSPSDYFYFSLTQYFTSNNGLWNNLTVPVGPGSQWQNPTGNADWSNISSVKYDFTWSERANVTARVDGLFFRGVFKSLMENSVTYISSFALLGVMQFVVNWVLLSALLYIVARALGGKTVWRNMLILVGFLLITLFVQAIINAVAYATLPVVYYPLEYFGGVEGERQAASTKVLGEIGLVYQVSTYTQIVVYLWTIALCAAIVRIQAEFSWSKSALVASAAYFASLLAVNFLLGY